MRTQVFSKSFSIYLCSQHMKHVKKFPCPAINFLWGGQQKTTDPWEPRAWSAGNCSTTFLKWPQHTWHIAALIHYPVNECNWMFNSENKYILSSSPRTVFLNKREQWRSSWDIKMLKIKIHSWHHGIWFNVEHMRNMKFNMKCELSQTTPVCLDFSILSIKMGCMDQYPVSTGY